jgi:alpha-tubulin suppressor-like RCC1 family protein
MLQIYFLFLEDGKLYSYGNGEYGALGLGGVPSCYTPQLLKKISDKKIIQIACGEYHTMALTGLSL